MSKHFLVVLAFLSTIACTENMPPVDFGKSGVVVLRDTSYMLSESAIPEGDALGILIEDLTGVKCNNCPKAANTALKIKDTTLVNENVVVVGIYPEAPRGLTEFFGDPTVQGFEDLRREESQQIATLIYQFGNQLPGGGVNRKVYDGQTSENIDFKVWGSAANSLVGEKSIVNIEMSKEQVSDSVINLQGAFTFTETPLFKPSVSIFLLENDIHHPQLDPDSKINYDYMHEHVLRKAYTPYNGTPLVKLSDPDIARGMVIEKGWQVTIPSYVDISHSSLVAIVSYNEGDNKEVLQCMELKLK